MTYTELRTYKNAIDVDLVRDSLIDNQFIDIDNIINHYNKLEVLYKSMDNRLSGYIYAYPNNRETWFSRKDTSYKIVINDSDTDLRKRFTIAHELGHFLIHETVLNRVGGTNDSKLYRNLNIKNLSLIHISEPTRPY